RQILPLLTQTRSQEDVLRVWVPGCATGEEVYSLAICIVEYLQEHDLNIPVQVFGTDLRESSLDYARAAVYPESIQADVSPERLRHFFVKTNGSYKVCASIRDMCIFAVQNLVKDPPF